MKMFSAFLSLLLMCGCEISVSTAPVGERPLNIAAEQKAWEGHWALHLIQDDEAAVPVSVAVPDASNGVLKVTLTVPDDDHKGNFKSETYVVLLRKGGGWTFANVEIKDEKNTNHPPCYAWGRLKKTERSACLWWSEQKLLDPLVKEGKVPAYDQGNSDVLGVFTSNHIAQITSETNGVLFKWDMPFIFMRLD